MEKELEKGTLVLDNGDEFGTVKIANDVVAMALTPSTSVAARLAIMAGNITNELMGKVGMKKLTKGVKVDILDKTVSADLAVTLEYGYNIPATCNKVQEKVKSAIETMTGLEVADVNIRIVGIEMADNK